MLPICLTPQLFSPSDNMSVQSVQQVSCILPRQNNLPFFIRFFDIVIVFITPIYHCYSSVAFHC